MASSLIIVLSVSFAASAAITWVWVQVARRYHVIDQPNARGAHSHPTPRGGGIAIVLVSVAAFLAFAPYFSSPADSLFYAVSLGGLAVGILGVLDDLYSLRARFRFAIQLAIAAGAVYFLPELPQLPVVSLIDWPSWLVFCAAVLSIVWSINLFNFMDGINGLAGSEAIFVLLGAVLILVVSGQHSDLGMLIVVVGAVLGFLVFNFPNAKVFMGDSGSCFLGYVIAIFALGSSGSDSISPWSWVILYGIFVVDTTVTLLVRIATGQKWYLPHNLHAYQKLARAQGSHARVTSMIFIVNVVWCLPLAVLATLFSDYSFLIVMIALIPITMGVVKLGGGRLSIEPTSLQNG
jgi:Fuc2NAc and GlcNAc transferase